MNEIIFFSVFLLMVLIMLFADLGMFSKKDHPVTFRRAVSWTLLWISIALGFYFLLRYYGHLLHGIDTGDPAQTLADIQAQVSRYHDQIDIAGKSPAEALAAYNQSLSLQYLTGYIIEYSLSIDNVFVILLIFMAFGVKQQYYKKVRFWGILGAIIMRFIFIFLLSALIYKFSWILFVFGAFLLIIAIKMLSDFIRKKVEKVDPENHPVVKFARRFFSVYPRYAGSRFWIRENGVFYITPLFIVLLVIEFTDVIFAVDSVPAIFSVTHDPFIVFFSNVFAIIGLRSLFFIFARFVHKFRFIKAGLAALLAFVGIKMLLHDYFPITTQQSLTIILASMGVSVVISIIMVRFKGSN